MQEKKSLIGDFVVSFVTMLIIEPFQAEINQTLAATRLLRRSYSRSANAP
jgi:hypothetical protein